jgi:hypothetical protein
MNPELNARGRVSGAMVVRVYAGSMVGIAVVAMMATADLGDALPLRTSAMLCLLRASAMPCLLLGLGTGAVLGWLGWRYLGSLLAAYVGFRLAFWAAARPNETSMPAIELGIGGGYGGCFLVLSILSWLKRRWRTDAAPAESEFSTRLSAKSTRHTRPEGRPQEPG